MSTSRVAAIVGLYLVLLSPAAAAEKPLPTEKAAAHMQVPDGFEVTLFAGEPDVVQPIAFTFDDRGRLWVVECTSYPEWSRDGTGEDRILIFEDTDGDGRFDRRKVFWDEGANLTGIALGFGGVWLCSTPNLLFLPDRNHDDVPDGPPEVVLEGWDLKGRHNVFNGLTWGPDGWLYGCNGILSNSKVGRPETPKEERISLNCGVWRYHPIREVFEVVANGTTNPWGLDFNDRGQMFITNCVIEHLFHVVPGAHFKRMHGQDGNPYVYRLIQTCADHIHWAGGPWQKATGGERHDKAGGGHAHAGAMIYLADNWPNTYRNRLFTCNIHGKRVNQDILKRSGSGYVARHGKDLLRANGPWFRGLELQYGPDGGVYMTDWNDTGECHDRQSTARDTGRIYKITHGKVVHRDVNLVEHSDRELARLQLHENAWYVRHARRLLQERAAAGDLDESIHRDLWNMVRDNDSVPRKLRALWCLHVTGGLTEEHVLRLLRSPHEYVRGWAIQLELEDREVSAEVWQRLISLSKGDSSPVVRLYLASGLQRLPNEQRLPIAEGLVGHGEDAADANLPLMLWYGIEPSVAAEPQQGLTLLQQADIPLIRRHIGRRITGLSQPSVLDALVQLLGRDKRTAFRRDVLNGIRTALEGRRRAPMPASWPQVYPELKDSENHEIRQTAMVLAALFGDEQAIAAMRNTLMDSSAEKSARRQALQALLQRRDPQLRGQLQQLVARGDLRREALGGLAAYKADSTSKTIVQHFDAFSAEEKRAAVSTLTSRPKYAFALLEAMEKGRIPRSALSAYNVRQMLQLDEPKIEKRLKNVWGTIRPTSKEKKKLIADYKAKLNAEALEEADPSRGRLVFKERCASCHKLFDDGKQIGPELTGSDRRNLDYVLRNLLDPSAVVARDYQMSVVQTRSGQTITGLVQKENDRRIVLQTPEKQVIVPKQEIARRRRQSVSLMPDQLLKKIDDDDLRALIAYLRSPRQVPLPKKEAGKPQSE